MRSVVLAAALAGCSFQVGATPPPQAGGDAPAPGDAPPGTVDAPQLTSDAMVDAMPDAAALPPFMLSGLRWLMPCTSGDLGSHNCNCGGPQVVAVQLGGAGADHYMVSGRIRGAMEAIGYSGGSQVAGGWHVGGSPANSADNIYKLEIDHPAQVYWLNPGTPTAQRSFKYDYPVTFMVNGNATVTFTASGQDTLQWANYDGNGPISFPGVVTTNPDPYNGQFADLDVEQVVLQ